MFDFGLCASSVFFFFVKNMDIAAEQRVAIKYCICRGKMTIETLSELKEAYYGDKCSAKLTLLKWHTIFVKDLNAVPVCAKPTGQPCSQITEMNINTVWAVIDEDRHVSIRQLKDTLHLPRMTICQIFTQEIIRCFEIGTENCFYANSCNLR